MKEKRRKICFFIIAVFLAVMLMQMVTYADDADLIKKIVGGNPKLFNENSIWSSVCRYIGMMILKGLAALAKACETVYSKSFGLVNFTKYSVVKDYFEKWRVVWGALLGASIAFLGVLMAVGHDKKPKIIENILIAVLVITSMNWMIAKMDTLVSKGVRNEIMGTEQEADGVYQIIGTNVRDLKYIEQVAGGLENINTKNAEGTKFAKVPIGTLMTEELFNSIDINEYMDPGDYSGDTKTILSYNVDMSLQNDNTVMYGIRELYNGVAWTSMMNTFYYRYKIDWAAAYLELLSLSLIYIFFAYKIVKTIYEIVWGEFLAILYSPNMAGGQKIVKILDMIKDCYIILLLTVVSVKMYQIACEYVASRDITGLTKGIILLFIALAVIDGPNVIQKLTGMDAGMSDGMAKMMSMVYGINAASSLGRMAGGIAKGAVQGGKSMFSKLGFGPSEGINGGGTPPPVVPENNGTNHNETNTDDRNRAENGTGNSSLDNAMNDGTNQMPPDENRNEDLKVDNQNMEQNNVAPPDGNLQNTSDTDNALNGSGNDSGNQAPPDDISALDNAGNLKNAGMEKSKDISGMSAKGRKDNSMNPESLNKAGRNGNGVPGTNNRGSINSDSKSGLMNNTRMQNLSGSDPMSRDVMPGTDKMNVDLGGHSRKTSDFNYGNAEPIKMNNDMFKMKDSEE